jgi:hypothetical protein
MSYAHQGETAIIGQQLAEPLLLVVSDNAQISLNQVRDSVISLGHSASRTPVRRLIA